MMLSLFALSILGISAIGTLFSLVGDDDDETVAEEEPSIEEEPVEEEETVEDAMPAGADSQVAAQLDLGVSVVDDGEGTVIVERGEDETGSLVLFNTYDSQDEGNGLGEYFEQRLYLLPEGQSLPELPPETQGNPVQLSDYEAMAELEVLGVWSLGAITPEAVTAEGVAPDIAGADSSENGAAQYNDTRQDGPQISANAPITVYDIETSSDGEGLVYVQPADPDWPGLPFNDTRNDAEFVTIRSDDLMAASSVLAADNTNIAIGTLGDDQVSPTEIGADAVQDSDADSVLAFENDLVAPDQSQTEVIL